MDGQLPSLRRGSPGRLLSPDPQVEAVVRELRGDLTLQIVQVHAAKEPFTSCIHTNMSHE